MNGETYTIDQIDSLNYNQEANVFSINDLDSMRMETVDNSSIDLTKFVNVPESLRQEWKKQGKIGYAEAINRKSLIDSIPFLGSIKAASELWKTKSAIDRVKDNNYGDNLKQRNDDINRVQNYLINLEERKTRGLTVGAKIAEGVSELPAFIGEFLASGPVSRVASTATKQAIEQGVARSVGTRIAGDVAGIATGAAARTATFGIPRVSEGFEERQLEARIEPTQRGIKIAQEIGEKPAVSFMRAIGDVYIENVSEMSGGLIGEGLGVVGGRISGIVPKRLSDGLEYLFKKIRPNDDIRNLFTKAGYNGFLEELGEERVGDFLRAVSNVEDFGANNPSSMFDRIVASIPSGEDMLVEAGILAVPGIGRASISGLLNSRKQEIADVEVPKQQLDLIANEVIKEKQESAVTGNIPISQTQTPVEQTEVVQVPTEVITGQQGVEGGQTETKEVSQEGEQVLDVNNIKEDGFKKLPEVSFKEGANENSPTQVILNDKKELSSEKTVKVPKEQLPVGEGKEETSRLAARIENKLDSISDEDKSKLPSYKKVNNKEQIQKASEYVLNSPNEAMAVLRGEKNPPEGLLYNSIFVAMRENAVGNPQLIRDLASLQSTRFGQEISVLQEVDPNDAVGYLKELQKLKIEAFGENEVTVKDSIKEAKSNEIANIKKSIKKKTSTKKDWNAFIQSIRC